MPLVLSTINDANLGTLTRLFEAIYNMFRAKGDMEMLKTIKAILQKLHIEESFRLKKIKSANIVNLSIPSLDELNIKLKSKTLERMWKRARLQIIHDAMTKDVPNGEFYAFAKKVQQADPVYQRQQVEKQRQYDEAFEEMLADSVLRNSDPTLKTIAFKELARKLSEKHGADSTKRAKELLGVEE